MFYVAVVQFLRCCDGSVVWRLASTAPGAPLALRKPKDRALAPPHPAAPFSGILASEKATDVVSWSAGGCLDGVGAMPLASCI